MNQRMKRHALALGLTTLCLAASTAEAQVKEAWVAKYDSPPIAGLSAADHVQDLEVRDGFVYVTGYESLFNGRWATIKYDYAGQELWVQRVTNGQTQRPEAMEVDAAGNVYVTGYQKEVGGGLHALTLKYDPDGALLWQELFMDAGGNVQPNDLAFDASGNVFVAGAYV